MLQRIFTILVYLFISSTIAIGQALPNELEKGFSQLSADAQFKHAVIGISVINKKTGNIVFEKNSNAGLAPASCQKILTSIAAFELLGKTYRYKTRLYRTGNLTKGKLQGDIYLKGVGDPTIGSNRWTSTGPTRIFSGVLKAFKKEKISVVEGDIICDDLSFSNDPVPHGWVWEDIGNYYGAGAWGFNWRENQFDLTFATSSRAGGATQLQSTNPAGVLSSYTFANRVTTGAAGSGDNAYLFSSPFHTIITARGTVPPTAKGFTISGSLPDPPGLFVKELKAYLQNNGIIINGEAWSTLANTQNKAAELASDQLLDSIVSPSLDSINYWFLKKSVNLFGEAFVKTIGFQAGSGETADGINAISTFWFKQGITKASLHLQDGSGLSPANRLTAKSLVAALQFASTRPWFSSFYNALPEMNGIKMKDGYISGVRSYTGFVKRKSGEELIFAIIVNNFDGSASTARTKLWKFLDVLK